MSPAPAKLPGRVALALAFAVVLDAVTHVAWKLSIGDLPAEASLLDVTRRAVTSPLFLVAMAGFLAQFWNWMRVLEHADLSYAQPITALGYVAVLIVSGLWLHEPVTVKRVAGVALILVGVYFISRTPFRTAVRGGEENV